MVPYEFAVSSVIVKNLGNKGRRKIEDLSIVTWITRLRPLVLCPSTPILFLSFEDYNAWWNLFSVVGLIIVCLLARACIPFSGVIRVPVATN